MALRRSVITAKPSRQLAAPRITKADPSVQRAFDGLAQELTPIVASPVLQGRVFDVELAGTVNVIEHGIGRVPQMAVITLTEAGTAAQTYWIREDDTDKTISIDADVATTARLWVF